MPSVRKTGSTLLLQLLAATLILLCLYACGKKGWPSPPKVIPPQPVTDLRSRVSGLQVELLWSVPPAADGAEPVTRFVVQRSADPVSETCKGCPILFTRIADIPVTSEHTVTWQDTIQKGYRYRYKVVGYSEGGLAGKDSNMIEVIGE